MWLARRGRARAWGVGGLGPFRRETSESFRHRGFPPSAWLGGCAFLLAGLALARPVLPPHQRLLLWDRSPSCELTPDALRGTNWETDGAHEVLEIGRDKKRFGDLELARKVQSLRGDRVLGVFTDRRAPVGLPSDVHWLDQPYREVRKGVQGGLLAAWPDGEGWKLHWRRWGATGSMRLEVRSEESPQWTLDLEGDGGLASVPFLGGHAVATLVPRDGGPAFDRPDWASLSLGPGGEVALAGDFSKLFRLAVEAALPGVGLSEFATAADAFHWKGSRPADAFPVRIILIKEVGGEEADWEMAVDPFETMEELDAVQLVAETLAPWREALEPVVRSVAEVAPAALPPPWASSPGGNGGAPGRPVGWHAAALGLLFYLSALLALSRGR